MYLKKTILALLFTGALAGTGVYGQNNTSLADHNLENTSSKDFNTIYLNDASFFKGDDERTCFIDFEHITVHPNDLVVKDESGQVIFSDKVRDLPLDTIYELDMATYPIGHYVIELRSYTHVMRQEVDLR